MIYTTDVICQDQLNISQHDGYVTVTCLNPTALYRPGGVPSEVGDIYSVQPTGELQTRPPGTDGPYEQAQVLTNGNVLYRPLGTSGFVLLGASLSPL